MTSVRWDELFADLEAQAAELERAERATEVGERTRGEFGGLGLRERLLAALDSSLRLRFTGALTVSAILRRVGPDWLLLDEGGGREIIASTAHLTDVRGLTRWSAVPGSLSVVESRLGLRQVVRGVARDRSPCRVHLADGSTLDATVDRVGSDFVEVATHAAGESRRRQDVRDVELVPLRALVALRRVG